LRSQFGRRFKCKIIVSGTALTKQNGNVIAESDAFIRPLGDEFPVFRLCVALCRGRVQTVYDFAESWLFHVDPRGRPRFRRLSGKEFL